MSRTCVLVLLAACGGGGGFPDAPPADSRGPTGTFTVAWSVIDQNNQPLMCDRVGGTTMTVLTHNVAFEGGSTEPFTCSTGMGTSQGLIPGTYEMNFELAGSVGTIARAMRQIGVVINANSNTELMPVTFQVEALGGVALRLASGKPGGNCGSTNAGGAGIEQMSITLNHNSDGSCEPITLTISDGATQIGGTYTVNCTTPVVRGCIEADQVLSANGVPSDSYTIRVRGLIASKNCWSNMDSIQVPPLNNVLIRTLNLAQQTQTPGC